MTPGFTYRPAHLQPPLPWSRAKARVATDSILKSETFDNDYFDIFDKLIEIETGVKA
jgi:hypothetical protein